MNRPDVVIYDPHTGNTLTLEHPTNSATARLRIKPLNACDDRLLITLDDTQVEDLIIGLGGLPPHR